LARHVLILAVAIGSLYLLSGRGASASERTGQQIYAELCAKCHGKEGEGTDENYPDRLAGDLSVGELSKVIDKTMPYKSPEKCSAEESQKVAEFIYAAFYSAIAQDRNRPARVELARLTVRQYQNAISDLVGSFRKYR
jgi:cytochrome c